MNSYCLNLVNLNNRKYIHGTSIVKGIFDKLKDFQFDKISNFEIRLKKQLLTQPDMFILDQEKYPDDAVCIGKFSLENTIKYFYLLSTNRPCTDILKIDESIIGTRLKESDSEWYMDVNDSDDIHVCFNQISKISNQQLFAEQSHIVIEKDKQTWFVGYTLPSLQFINQSYFRIGISKQYKMLTPICMKRQITVNNIIVGDRTCIYS